MCNAIFIASPRPLEEDGADCSVKRKSFSEKVREYIQSKMNFPNIYEVISNEGCACDLFVGVYRD